MRVKVRWKIEVIETYEAVIEIDPDDIPPELTDGAGVDLAALRDYLDEGGEGYDYLPDAETDENRKGADVKERYVSPADNAITILGD